MHLFISDLHLQASRPDLTQCFLRFLNSLHPTHSKQHPIKSLTILGDFFEYWVGDDAIETWHRPIIQALNKASQTFDCFFIHGNRDFLIGADFADQTGFEILNPISTIKLYGVPTLIMHGDELCTDDLEYQKLRSTLRDPNWQQAFLSKPIEARLAYAQQLRMASRAAEKSEADMDVCAKPLFKVLAEHNAEAIIHGHTHKPAAHPLKTLINQSAGHHPLHGHRWVLSDWDQRASVLRVTEQSCSLNFFPVIEPSTA